jgi:DNA-binding HxlR family transcriptional regulator
VRRREIDGCPITGALQMLGDKWSLLVVRELASGPKHMMEIHNGLAPISSRTLVARLRDMVNDNLLTRTERRGLPNRVEYGLTERGQLLVPLVEALRVVGEALGCNECEDRKELLGSYCNACPIVTGHRAPLSQPRVAPTRQPERDDSIVLL